MPHAESAESAECFCEHESRESGEFFFANALFGLTQNPQNPQKEFYGTRISRISRKIAMAT